MHRTILSDISKGQKDIKRPIKDIPTRNEVEKLLAALLFIGTIVVCILFPFGF